MLHAKMMTEEMGIIQIGEAMIGLLIGGEDHQALTEERGQVLTMELAVALLPTEETEGARCMAMAQAVVLVAEAHMEEGELEMVMVVARLQAQAEEKRLAQVI